MSIKEIINNINHLLYNLQNFSLNLKLSNLQLSQYFKINYYHFIINRYYSYYYFIIINIMGLYVNSIYPTIIIYLQYCWYCLYYSLNVINYHLSFCFF